jgi:hypothetical protein
MVMCEVLGELILFGVRYAYALPTPALHAQGSRLGEWHHAGGLVDAWGSGMLRWHVSVPQLSSKAIY